MLNARYRKMGFTCLAVTFMTVAPAIVAQDRGSAEESPADEPFPEGNQDPSNGGTDWESNEESSGQFEAFTDANGDVVPEDFQDSLPFTDPQPQIAQPRSISPPPPPPVIGRDERPSMTRRVSLGFTVNENEAKFQAQISYTPDPMTWDPALSQTPLWARKHICGGALIARDWVLTAAHCINAKKLERGLTVKLGAEDIAKPGDGMQLRVDRIVIHRRYSMFQNDIALLHLAPDTRMRNPSEIGQIELHAGPEPAKDTAVSSMGWGQIKEAATGTQPSAILFRADQKLIPVADCKGLPGFGPNENGVPRINNRVLCAGKSRSKTCSGDSGGPLVMTDGPRLLVGIVAWNKADCNNPANPGVYTRVSAFIGWIRKGMATTAAGGRVQFLDD